MGPLHGSVKHRHDLMTDMKPPFSVPLAAFRRRGSRSGQSPPGKVAPMSIATIVFATLALLVAVWSAVSAHLAKGHAARSADAARDIAGALLH